MTNIRTAIKFAENEIKSLELAPKINGCEMTELWKKQIEIWKTAIYALEKQIPKKVEVTKYDVGDNDYFCHCGNKLRNSSEYCDKCGCKLDWSDTNDR